MLILSFLSIQPTQAADCTTTTSSSGSTRFVKITSASGCTWLIPSGVSSLDFVLVGGGGGGSGGGSSGGAWNLGGGGGGAGGVVVVTTSYSVIGNNNLTLTVGSGGSGSAVITAANAGTSTTLTYSGSTITARVAGFHLINMNIQFGTGASYAAAGYLFEGSTLRAHVETQSGANTSADSINVSAVMYLAANATLTARVAASTSGKTITVGTQNAYISVINLGAMS